MKMFLTLTCPTVKSKLKSALTLTAMASRQVHTVRMSTTGAQTFCTLIHIYRENNCSITSHNTLMLTNHTTRFIVLDAGCLGVCQTCHSGAGEIKHASILPFVMTEEDSEGCRPCRSAWEQAWGSGWVKSWSAGDLVLIIANYREGKEHTVPLSLLIFLCSLCLTPLLSTLEWRVQTGDKSIL